jgi:ubiquinone/menaquinone biosynthesis C-methylase UbiE
MTRPRAPGVSPRFLALLSKGGLDGRRLLDVGCGWGRLALALAPSAERVVGLDRDPALIQEARRRAVAAGIANVEFREADVERAEYALFSPDLITAHLCVSDAIVERAGRALSPGDRLAMVSFHVDQWRETGKVSRFAYDAPRMEALLHRAGFRADVIEVEREVAEFATVEEALAAAVGLEGRWKVDGRWPQYLRFLEEGGRTLTRSHLIVVARRS